MVRAGTGRVTERGQLRHRRDAVCLEDAGNGCRIHRVCRHTARGCRHLGGIIQAARRILERDHRIHGTLCRQLLGSGGDGSFIGQGGHIHLCPQARHNISALDLGLRLLFRHRGSCRFAGSGALRPGGCTLADNTGCGKVTIPHHGIPGVGGPVQHMGRGHPGRCQHGHHQHRNADALFQPHLAGVKAAPVALDLLAFGISCHNQPPSLGSTYRITEWPVKP